MLFIPWNPIRVYGGRTISYPGLSISLHRVFKLLKYHVHDPRGHWPKGVWGCAALNTPFSRLSCRSQGSHFKQKRQFTRPLLRKFGNFSLYSFNFHPKFSSQAPKFGNFQLTSPRIWKFSARKPPNLEIFCSQAPLFRGKCQFASPTLRKSGPHTPTWKKLSVTPRVHHDRLFLLANYFNNEMMCWNLCINFKLFHNL